MVMVSMRPKTHVHSKIHEQVNITSLKFFVTPIKSFDAMRGRWNREACLHYS